MRKHHSEPRGNNLDTKRMLAEVEQEIAKLRRVADALRGTESAPQRPANSHGAGRTLSASARKRMSLAQKARWAKRSGNNHVGELKPRRTLSASARRKIAAAQRARWAKIRGKKTA
jgi:hypothetical protein